MLLQTNSEKRALVLDLAPHSVPYSLPPTLVKPSGTGQCTCCRLGHQWRDNDGIVHTMPCDRHAILVVTETMLQLRIFHESSQSVNAWRCWRAYKAYWLQGLSTSSSYSVAAVHPQHAASEPDPQQKLAHPRKAKKMKREPSGAMEGDQELDYDEVKRQCLGLTRHCPDDAQFNEHKKALMVDTPPNRIQYTDETSCALDAYNMGANPSSRSRARRSRATPARLRHLLLHCPSGCVVRPPPPFLLLGLRGPQ
jgi:hypothetical protein